MDRGGKMLNSMKLKNKMILGFLIVGLFSLLVGAVGLSSVFTMDQNTKAIYSDHLIPTTFLFDIQKNMMMMNNTYDLMLYEKDINQTKKRIEQIEALAAENEALINQYNSVMKNEADELYQKFIIDLDASNSERIKISECLAVDNTIEAMNIAPNYHARVTLVNRDIQNLIDFQTQTANDYLLRTEQTFAQSIIFVVGISILCLIFAILAGSYLARKISKPIGAIADAAEQLAVGNIDIDVETDLKDEIGELYVSFQRMTENTRMQVSMAKRIVAGDLDIEIVPRSEKDILGFCMQSVVNTLRCLVDESKHMTEAALNGQLSNRGDSESFCGGYYDIIEGFNQTLDAVVNPLHTAANHLKRISCGDIPEPIAIEYRGDFNEIQVSLNTCIQAVSNMVDDVEMLADAAINGRLGMRADEKIHQGKFQEIVAGFNQTLDAVTDPLQIASSSIQEIGKGRIPDKIIEDYSGAFNDIKTSINDCIDGLAILLEGKELLLHMSNNDFSGRLREDGNGVFLEIAQSINYMNHNISEMKDFICHVSEGDFTDLEYLKLVGRRSEQDQLIPSITLMIETLNRLISETNQLTEHAVHGKLELRGDSSQYSGEFKKLVEGINQTLDAVNAPVKEASLVLKELSEGNLYTLMEGEYRGQHAEMKNAMNGTILNLKQYIEAISLDLAEIGKGNLSFEVGQDFKGSFIKIQESMGQILCRLNEVMGQIDQSAEQVAIGSRQVADGSQDLSRGAMEQAYAIEELSSSISEISNQIKNSTVHANQAKKLAITAKLNAEKGNEQMQQMLHSMSDIQASSMDISKIIKVIDDIAFQTNILALNAAVEAARAGQSGKGFAVVAEEVRNLAVKSAEAAKKTSNMIEVSLGRTKAGIEIADETARSFQEIVSSIEQAAELVINISATSNDQARGIDLINKGIEQVSIVVQSNSSSAEESAAISEQLSGQAMVLMETIGTFQRSERIQMITKNSIPYILEPPQSFDYEIVEECS